MGLLTKILALVSKFDSTLVGGHHATFVGKAGAATVRPGDAVAPTWAEAAAGDESGSSGMAIDSSLVTRITLSGTSSMDLLRIPADKVAFIEPFAPADIPRLTALLRGAHWLTAERYQGKHTDLPSALLVPSVYVLTDPKYASVMINDQIARTGAIPISRKEWPSEQKALKSLLSD